MVEIKKTIYCDRCGKKIEETDYKYTVDIFISTEKGFQDTKNLCKDCTESFRKWMTYES